MRSSMKASKGMAAAQDLMNDPETADEWDSDRQGLTLNLSLFDFSERLGAVVRDPTRDHRYAQAFYS